MVRKSQDNFSFQMLRHLSTPMVYSFRTLSLQINSYSLGITMADEHLIKLLEEIRDLQKQQIENSRQAIANQQHAIETQKQAVRRGRTVLILVGVIVLAIYFLPVFWWTLGWGLRCAPRH